MCLGVVGRIVTLPGEREDVPTGRPARARVDVEGVLRDVDLALLDGDPVAAGDWVLIHLGFALQKLTQAEADETRSLAG